MKKTKNITEIGEDTKLGLDIDGDGKPDFHINLKTIGMVVAAIVSVTMFYFQIQADIEEAKLLPIIGTGQYVIDASDAKATATYPPTRVEFQMKDQMSRMTIDQLMEKVDEIEDDIQEIKIELAKKRDR
jgi:hypothetical protein